MELFFSVDSSNWRSPVFSGGKEQVQLLEEFLQSDSKPSKGKSSRGENVVNQGRKQLRPTEYTKRRKYVAIFCVLKALNPIILPSLSKIAYIW